MRPGSVTVFFTGLVTASRAGANIAASTAVGALTPSRGTDTPLFDVGTYS